MDYKQTKKECGETHQNSRTATNYFQTQASNLINIASVRLNLLSQIHTFITEFHLPNPVEFNEDLFDEEDGFQMPPSSPQPSTSTSAKGTLRRGSRAGSRVSSRGPSSGRSLGYELAKVRSILKEDGFNTPPSSPRPSTSTSAMGTSRRGSRMGSRSSSRGPSSGRSLGYELAKVRSILEEDGFKTPPSSPRPSTSTSAMGTSRRGSRMDLRASSRGPSSGRSLGYELANVRSILEEDGFKTPPSSPRPSMSELKGTFIWKIPRL
jgi:hypothetical protein